VEVVAAVAVATAAVATATAVVTREDTNQYSIS